MASRAKKAKVRYVRREAYQSSYVCPHCGDKVDDAELSIYVTRFKCKRCDGEIISVPVYVSYTR